jgi:hypothetical protein
MSIGSNWKLLRATCVAMLVASCGSWAGNPIGDGSDSNKGSAIVELDYSGPQFSDSLLS